MLLLFPVPEGILERTGLHKCAAAPQRVSNAKLIDAQDLMMKTNPDMAPLSAVNQSLALLNDAEKRFTPRSSSMRQRLGKKRRRKLGLGPAPTDYSFEVPDKLKTFTDGELFVLEDTGCDDPQRILLFGDTQFQTQGILAPIKHLYGDGTYDRCALQSRRGYRDKKFSTLYVIMGERETMVQAADGELVCNRLVLPIVFALLPSTDEETYIRFFQTSQKVKTAVQTVYSGIAVEGDSFHLVQAITRRLKKERISQLYVNEVEVYEQVRLLLTPFFVPFNQMVSFFHDVVKRLVTRSELQGLVSYVERTWIGQEATLTRREKRPLFKREHSNLYQATIEGRPRHNNHMESNNAKLNKLIKENPSMWDMMLGLRSAIRGDYRLLYNEWAQELCNRGKGDVAKDQRILNACQKVSMKVSNQIFYKVVDFVDETRMKAFNSMVRN
uniref:MULE transposase domain-containing protein n=1 Tax=Ditylenchus dipsaci TaxID=166011 RepID=A0A915E7A0_9BILA